MGISLYTSRVILEELGVSDYGIYNLLAGILTMIGFFNAAMSSATQRYLSYDIGQEDYPRLKKTFSATLTIHIGIAFLGLVIAETVGLWYVNKVMVFPEEKWGVVNIVYQFSILTFLLSIIQVPYNALIIAHERMKVYAYMSILEAILKLGTVFVLMLATQNKLIIFAILTFCVSLIIRIGYQIFCRLQFKESKYSFEYDKTYFLELISYSGWSLFGNIAVLAKVQGVNMLLNLFFGLVINASYAITNQLVNAINLVVSNLQMAFNPQIIKNYSQGNLEETARLVIQGAKISFFLSLVIIMPVLLNTEYILQLWLKEVPFNTVLFVQLALIGVLIESLSGTLIIGVQATGNIKWYQIILGIIIFLNLPIAYLFFKLNYGAYFAFLISIVISFFVLSFRFIFLTRILNFRLKGFLRNVILKAALVSILMFFCYLMHKKYLLEASSFLFFLIETCLIEIVLIFAIYFIGISKNERLFLRINFKQILNK